MSTLLGAAVIIPVRCTWCGRRTRRARSEERGAGANAFRRLAIRLEPPRLYAPVTRTIVTSADRVSRLALAPLRAPPRAPLCRPASKATPAVERALPVGLASFAGGAWPHETSDPAAVRLEHREPLLSPLSVLVHRNELGGSLALLFLLLLAGKNTRSFSSAGPPPPASAASAPRAAASVLAFAALPLLKSASRSKSRPPPSAHPSRSSPRVRSSNPRTASPWRTPVSKPHPRRERRWRQHGAFAAPFLAHVPRAPGRRGGAVATRRRQSRRKKMPTACATFSRNAALHVPDDVAIIFPNSRLSSRRRLNDPRALTAPRAPGPRRTMSSSVRQAIAAMASEARDRAVDGDGARARLEGQARVHPLRAGGDPSGYNEKAKQKAEKAAEKAKQKDVNFWKQHKEELWEMLPVSLAAERPFIKVMFVSSVVALLCSKLCNVASPIALKYAIDAVVDGEFSVGAIFAYGLIRFGGGSVQRDQGQRVRVRLHARRPGKSPSEPSRTSCRSSRSSVPHQSQNRFGDSRVLARPKLRCAPAVHLVPGGAHIPGGGDGCVYLWIFRPGTSA